MTDDQHIEQRLVEMQRLLERAHDHQVRARDLSLPLEDRFQAYVDAACIRSELGFKRP